MFGSIFEGALSHDTRRAGGMHYTSPENIHKLIDPLFLDGLKAELAEIMSLGTVSKLYGNLDSSRSDVPKLVARGFGLKPYILKSWLRHLTCIRNICGHHDRFYNRVMTTKAGLLKADARYDSNKESQRSSFSRGSTSARGQTDGRAFSTAWNRSCAGMLMYRLCRCAFQKTGARC